MGSLLYIGLIVVLFPLALWVYKRDLGWIEYAVGIIIIGIMVYSITTGDNRSPLFPYVIIGVIIYYLTKKWYQQQRLPQESEA